MMAPPAITIRQIAKEDSIVRRWRRSKTSIDGVETAVELQIWWSVAERGFAQLVGCWVVSVLYGGGFECKLPDSYVVILVSF